MSIDKFNSFLENSNSISLKDELMNNLVDLIDYYHSLGLDMCLKFYTKDELSAYLAETGKGFGNLRKVIDSEAIIEYRLPSAYSMKLTSDRYCDNIDFDIVVKCREMQLEILNDINIAIKRTGASSMHIGHDSNWIGINRRI